jgi:hypothetical protein
MGGSRIRALQGSVAIAATVFLATAGMAVGLAGTARAATYKGKSVAVGHGTARVVVRTNAAGAPESVAVELSSGALDGLPTTLNKETAEGEWEFDLPMPASGPKTGYRAVAVDWNPHGHPPPGIYTVPHFDFHFYAIDEAQVAKVAFTGPKDPAAVVADKGLIAPGYEVVPDTVVNKMGVHAVDTTAPEFHGKPFTTTFIYGYCKGRLIFVEPMVTRAFLESKPDITMPVKTPAHYSVSGYYPTSYSVRYDAGRKTYMVALGKLKHWQKN